MAHKAVHPHEEMQRLVNLDYEQSVALLVTTGSRHEKGKSAGLAHYYEHLIYRGGSARQQELEWRRRMQQLLVSVGVHSDYLWVIILISRRL